MCKSKVWILKGYHTKTLNRGEKQELVASQTYTQNHNLDVRGQLLNCFSFRFLDTNNYRRKMKLVQPQCFQHGWLRTDIGVQKHQQMVWAPEESVVSTYMFFTLVNTSASSCRTELLMTIMWVGIHYFQKYLERRLHIYIQYIGFSFLHERGFKIDLWFHYLRCCNNALLHQ